MEWWLPEITIIALGFASRTVSVVSDHQTSQHQLNLIISSWENWYSDSSIIYRDIVISILSSTWHRTESPRSPESSAPCYKLTVWNIVIEVCSNCNMMEHSTPLHTPHPRWSHRVPHWHRSDWARLWVPLQSQLSRIEDVGEHSDQVMKWTKNNTGSNFHEISILKVLSIHRIFQSGQAK